MRIRELTDTEKKLLQQAEEFVQQALPRLSASERRMLTGRIFRELRKAWKSNMQRLRRESL